MRGVGGVRVRMRPPDPPGELDDVACVEYGIHDEPSLGAGSIMTQVG